MDEPSSGWSLVRFSIHTARRELKRAKAVVDQFGLAAAAGKVVPYAARLLARRASYIAHRKSYPLNVIFMASFSKSGSTWLANMLSELPGFSRYQPAGWTASLNEEPNEDIYPGMFDEVRRALVIIKGHTRGTRSNAGQLLASNRKYLITVRDPRDQIISDYWYTRNRPGHPNHPTAMRLDLRSFIDRELNPLLSGTQRADWIREWLTHRDPRLSLLVRYEDLLVDTSGTLDKIFTFLGLEGFHSSIPKIVSRHEFAQRSSGRTPGAEDTSSFVRKGVSGEWRDIFTEELKAAFAVEMEDIVTALGYEPTVAPSERLQ